MNYVAEIILALFTMAMVGLEDTLIKANKPIKHGWWALLFITVMCGTVYILDASVLDDTRTILGFIPLKTCFFVIAVSLTHLVEFNLALNRVRGLDWFYVSKTPKSILDQLEVKLFGSTGIMWFEIALIVIVITLQFFL